MTKIKSLDYLDKIVNLNYSDEEFFMNYYRLTDHLRAINFEASFPNCLMLLNNNLNILRLVKHIVENNMDDILAGDFTKFTKDLMLISLIKAYCFSNGIKFTEKQLKIKHIDSPVLAAKEEKKLIDLHLKGCKQAKDIIILKNIGLIKYCAFKFADKHGISDSHYIEDMISAGTIGLYKALDKFDCKKGTRFSTYAFTRIMGDICYYCSYETNLVTQPAYFINLKNMCHRAENVLTIELGRQVTIEDIATYLDVSVENVELVYEKTSKCISSFTDKDGKVQNIFDFLPSDDIVDQDLPAVEIKRLFDACQLTEKQRKAIIGSYVYHLGLKEIGDRTGVTKQAVEINLQRGIVKIARSKYVHQLIEYMPNSQRALAQINEIIKKDNDRLAKERLRLREKKKLIS